MLGKKKINQIRSLAQKKYRQKEKLFLAEGNKIVLELLNSRFLIKELIATAEFIGHHKSQLQEHIKITAAATEEIRKASLLKNPQQSLALCELPSETELPEKISGLAFYLDGLQDPGNLGTIIRIADWFGMEFLFCSPGTADIYNPKVIQASMGSFCRVKTVYASFNDVVSMANRSGIEVYGAFMDGKSIYSSRLTDNAIIVLGNEGNGISENTAEKITTRLSIPSFSTGKSCAESLNVAIAAGIIGSEFRRQAIR